MPTGKILFALVLAFALSVLADSAVAAADAPADVPVVEHPASDEIDYGLAVENYLDWFFRRTDGKRLAKAKVLVPLVVAAAQKESLDPLLVAVTISFESSWSPKAVGGIGEVGLMQVHGLATEGFDVTTIEGNLAAGCAWLASRIMKFGGLEEGVAAYMGFSERARRSAKYRLMYYRAELKRQGLRQSGEIS